MSWIYLLTARVFEVDFITFLKLWLTLLVISVVELKLVSH